MAKALAKSVGEDAADLTNRLHVGLGGNETADAGLAVRRLAALARREGLAGLLGDPAEACAKSPVFAAAVDEVIAEFGHRGPAELELANPTWRSDRSLLFGAVDREASRLDTPPAGQGDDTVRLAAEQELVERLGRVKAAVIKPLVRRSQRLLPIRENAQDAGRDSSSTSTAACSRPSRRPWSSGACSARRRTPSTSATPSCVRCWPAPTARVPTSSNGGCRPISAAWRCASRS